MSAKTRRRRRLLINISLLSLVLAALAFWFQWQDANLESRSFSTGYILIGALFFLAAFNLRKKLPFLPILGTSRFWMQLHIHVGFATFLVFAFHIGFKVPNGVLETALAVLYLLVAFSGVYGLYVTKVIPRKLTHLNDEIIYEQIPSRRAQLVRQLSVLMDQTLSQNETLARFYTNRLAPFFEKPRTVAYQVCPTTRQSRRLQSEIKQLDRFLTSPQRNIGQQLIDLVRRKDNLDFHRAMQGRLKYWLFLHIGLTYSLLIVSVVHGIMAHAFHGGMR